MLLKDILTPGQALAGDHVIPAEVSRGNHTCTAGRHDACCWHPDGRHELRERMGSFGNADSRAVEA
jgi:hypothetical protein